MKALWKLWGTSPLRVAFALLFKSVLAAIYCPSANSSNSLVVINITRLLLLDLNWFWGPKDYFLENYTSLYVQYDRTSLPKVVSLFIVI